MPEISVIICTYNRCNDLKDLLNCLLNQEMVNEGIFEVIIIDNNSKDQTKKTVASYTPKFHGKLRYFFEPRQGKPFALNLGIKEAQGNILVFTDDDCLVEKDYIGNIYKAYQEYGNEIGAVWGKITPAWINGGKPPEWFVEIKKGSIFERFFNGPLGILDDGDEPFIVNHTQGINTGKQFYGANITIRKEVLDRHGHFNTQKTLTQDSEICNRLLKAGVKGMYVPQIIVHHKVNTKNITPDYYYRWNFIRGKYREINETFNKKKFYPLGIPFWVIKLVIISYLNSFFKKERYLRIYSKCIAIIYLEEIKKSLRSKFQSGNEETSSAQS